MKRFTIILAMIIGAVRFSACEWEPVYLWYPKDNSKITMNITCPSLGLENTTFCNTERDWWHKEQNLIFHHDTSFSFRLRKDLISNDSNYKAHILINLHEVLPSLEFGHKYNINNLDESGYPNGYISISIDHTKPDDEMYYEQRPCVDGYVEFTSSMYNGKKYIVSGNFEFIFENAIISNGTFTDLECI